MDASSGYSWKASYTALIVPKLIKKRLKKTLSKHGTNATKRLEYGAGTQAENINDSSVGTRPCDG